MNIDVWAELSGVQKDHALSRPAKVDAKDTKTQAEAIVAGVRAHGDVAIREFSERFDGGAPARFEVSNESFARAEAIVDASAHAALLRASKQITSFHEAGRPIADIQVETSPGVMCSCRHTPIQRVGLYAPGGSAPLPSTVLMLGIPASLASCPITMLCTPPGPDGGDVDPHILVAARLAGIDRVFAVGGAQAIAAMAYGSASIPKVDKIFGPGNAFVTAAKQLVAADPDGAAIDMPAGPSEVLVIADENANPDFVAADLLSQAEHGPDSQAVLLSTSIALLTATAVAVEEQLKSLPRAAIIAQSLVNCRLILMADENEAVLVSNQYAPEHLILNLDNAEELLNHITNAGSVFVGPFSPESAGDYASGTNHVLPTYGYARSYGGVGVESFTKTTTVQRLTPAGLIDLGPTIVTLAEIEGLRAHANAVTKRLDWWLASREQSATESLFGADDVADAEDIAALARHDIAQLRPYQSARELAPGGEVFLDANELPAALAEDSAESSSAAARTHGPLNAYPEPQPVALVQRLAELYETSSDNLVVSRGSDDIIDGLVRAFCHAGRDAIVVTPPTYGVYGVAAGIQGANVVQAPLIPLPAGGAAASFTLSVQSVVDRVLEYPRHRQDGGRAKLVFVCRPNNPTGQAAPLQQVSELCAALAGHAVVVVDEAYIEFSQHDSAITLQGKHSNLVVLRTLSKAWGLAGARCGTGVAHRQIVQLLHKVRAPYPLSAPSVAAVLRAIDEEGLRRCKENVAHVVALRAKLSAELAALPAVLHVFPSDANFLLVRTDDPDTMVRMCSKRGIVIRDRSEQLNLSGCVRISVGSDEDHDRLLAALTGKEAN